MNKEAIERTKARTSRLNSNAAVNPKEAGVIVPRPYYIPEINTWSPLSKKELIAVPIIACIFGALIYWWLS